MNNEDLRKVYDEYLANPNANEYYQYYQFYKAVYAPQLDPRLVVGLVLSAVSVFQYFTRRYMYRTAISSIQRTTKFQTLVNQRFEEEKAAKSGMVGLLLRIEINEIREKMILSKSLLKLFAFMEVILLQKLRIFWLSKLFYFLTLF